MFSAMLTDAFNVDTPDIDIRHRTDGKLYNPRRLQAKTKVHTDRLRDFLFADDCAQNAGNEADMQNSMDLYSTACDNFGLTISTNKVKAIQYQPAPGKLCTEPTVTVPGVKLAAVDRRPHRKSQCCLRETTIICMGTQRCEPDNQDLSLQSSPHCCKLVRPGLSIKGMQRNSIVPNSAASTSCLELVGRTRSPTQKSSSSQERPASSPSYNRHNSVGLAI
ncbi:hypothetical protein ElyMa_006939200 [Elysia marginata]|uniref:Reverse transcriptase domain-containing protein n=1 Tax=Elysia marginata TaxID=1093978 RepID=A0AAV4JKU7_9GAST|nr:hypothetical protein ElyMa_006939200 [Elysia marginata]